MTCEHNWLIDKQLRVRCSKCGKPKAEIDDRIHEFQRAVDGNG